MNELEQLRDLLFGAEKQALDSITDRIERRESRAADVADVLPEAVRLSHKQGKDLVATLREPVGECLQDSFHREPGRYADALYPVMGPAIRKSIVSALRGFAQQINETIEQSLSVRGLKWRFEAWRSGIPFGEYVVQRSLQYRVEQAYLISRENGLLIGHVHHQASRIKDSDAVSAMFTAIQDFVKESFSPDRTGRLETADMGEFTLWAVHGPHALLVCVIRGVPPRSLRGDLSAILERIHFRYADAIRDYAGDTSTVVGVEGELSECLHFEAQQPADSKKPRSRLPLLFIVLLAAAAVAYVGLRIWETRQQLLSLENTLASTPGWYVSSVDHDDGVFIIDGLRDPLAPTLGDVVQAAGLEGAQVQGYLRPFQSLAPEIVYYRTRIALDVPASAALALEGDKVVVRGTAPFEWIRKTQFMIDANVLPMAVVLDDVSSSELDALKERAAALQEFSVAFVRGAELEAADASKLLEYAGQVGRLAQEAARIGASVQVLVVGHTDTIGTAESNRELAQQRAAVAVDLLLEEGVPGRWVGQSLDVDSGVAGEVNPERRRVTVRLQLNPVVSVERQATE